METVNIHTHKLLEPDINILDASTFGGLISGRFCSMGIHPMYIDAKTEERLYVIEDAARGKQLVAIGESGLDRNSSTPIAKQLELFARQIEIAEQCELPLIIHCVRAFPELISLYKKYLPRQAWIIHGFNNNREILKELLKHGFYISAGKNIMNESSNIFHLLPEIPLDRLFLENDDSDYGIEAIYEIASRCLQINTEQLKEIVYNNFMKLFRV